LYRKIAKDKQSNSSEMSSVKPVKSVADKSNVSVKSSLRQEKVKVAARTAALKAVMICVSIIIIIISIVLLLYCCITLYVLISHSRLYVCVVRH
jgi:t-SNARE complex subunit (syntaxin)